MPFIIEKIFYGGGGNAKWSYFAFPYKKLLADISLCPHFAANQLKIALFAQLFR